MGKLIWHYTDMYSFVQILKFRTLHFSKATRLNDSEELSWVKKILDETNDQKEALEDDKLQELQEIAKITEIKDRVSPFASCFSLSPDVLSQWRAYADQGRGVSFGFDKEWLLKNINEFYGTQNITVFSNKVGYLKKRHSFKGTLQRTFLDL